MLLLQAQVQHRWQVLLQGSLPEAESAALPAAVPSDLETLSMDAASAVAWGDVAALAAAAVPAGVWDEALGVVHVVRRRGKQGMRGSGWWGAGEAGLLEGLGSSSWGVASSTRRNKHHETLTNHGEWGAGMHSQKNSVMGPLGQSAV